jgi:3-hydroxybutyryl-CoA dehydratase
MNLGFTINELNVGDSASSTKVITDECMSTFMQSVIPDNESLDRDMHNDQEVAKMFNFDKKMAYGLLVAGTISYTLGYKLPGLGAIYLSQDIKFKAPVFVGDTITATVEVKEILTEKNRVILRTYVTNQDGNIVLDGQAIVIPPSRNSNNSVA